MISDIWRYSFMTKKGNQLSFFYNHENNLLVVDLVDKSKTGGNEIVRKILDEDKLLSHLKKGVKHEKGS